MRRVLLGTLLVVVLMIPLAGARVPGTGLRVALIALLVPGALAFLYVLRDRLWDFASPPLLAAAVFTLSTIVSLPAAANTHAVDLTLMTIAGLGCAAAVVAVSGPAQIALILEVFCLVAGVVAAISLSQAGSLTSQLGGSVVSGRLQGLFSQPNELGGFCALALPIVLVTARYTEGRARRVALWACAVAITVALALSLSRGAWLGGLAGLVMVTVLLPDARRALTWAALAAVTAAAGTAVLPQSQAILAVLDARVHSVTGGAAQPYDARPQIWAQALKLAGQHPWLGVGPGGYQSHSQLPASGLYAQPPEHAHSIVLTVLAEQGLLGVVALLAMGAALLATGARLITRTRTMDLPATTRVRWTTAAPLAGLSGIAVHGLTDMPLRNPILNVAVWIIFGCAASGAFTRRPRANESAPENAQEEARL
ncbi:MAG: O-antigen ligase family protein [Actinomycetota bacterium]|nr:O-antigen ligase family protein [Actinomycetota bacterium]